MVQNQMLSTAEASCVSSVLWAQQGSLAAAADRLANPEWLEKGGNRIRSLGKLGDWDRGGKD